MAEFEIPTAETLLAEIFSEIKAWRSDAATSPGSDAFVLAHTLRHIGYSLHIHLKYGVLYNIIPWKASGVFLDGWLVLFGLPDGLGGVGRIKLRGSTATDGVTITATGQASPDYDLQNEEFTATDGTTFKINQSIMQNAVWSATDHEALVDVASVTKGTIANIEVAQSETFTWVATPDSMSTTITQEADFDGGADQEKDSEGRARLSYHLGKPPQGGNWRNWETWIEDSSPGALAAYVWPKRAFSDVGYGYGCVDYCALQTNESGTAQHIASGSDLWDTIDDAIEETAPVLLMRSSRQLTITNVPQAIELDLELGTSTVESDLCDWDAEDLDTTTAAYTSAYHEITCSAAVNGHISAGDRVLIYDSTAEGHAYHELDVNAVGVAGGCTDNSSFRTGAWPWGSTSGPANGLAIMSGGGLIGAAIDAIQAYCDGIGPAAGPYAAPVQGWDDTFRISGIKTAVINAGNGKIIDMTMIAPTVDVAPSYDDDSDVERITPSEIIVWEPK